MPEYAFPTTVIRTRRCLHCGNEGTVTIPTEAYVKLTTTNVLIQEALPELSIALREQLISGIHPECWEKLF